MVLYFKNKFFPKGSFRHATGVAFDSEKAFFASGCNDGGSIHFATIPNTSFTDLTEWVAKSFGDTNPVEVNYVPGKCYKRIWKPLVCSGTLYKTISQEKLNESFVALRILLNKLESIFETIEPNQSNLFVHGHKIRELLLLACMEVESSWSSVLKENNYNTANQKLDTNDYIKLKSPMLLDGYELTLRAYPNSHVFNPFENWNNSAPTKTLGWYDAYNQAKHNREENFKLATLKNAIEAVGATVVMFHAQYGSTGSFNKRLPIISNFFKITTVGFKKYEKDFYIPKIDLHEDSNQPAPLMDWEQTDYPF